jgi:hypothetical protein
MLIKKTVHKPTFSPDKTPNLLLIAMMAIGASCLDKIHGYEVTQAGAELSNFLAWHLRWEIFSDYHFRPPAKLWVFQALLLLELYEKSKNPISLSPYVRWPGSMFQLPAPSRLHPRRRNRLLIFSSVFDQSFA